MNGFSALPPSELAAVRLAAIVDSSDDAIVSKDLDGVIQTWNRGAERIFGYTAAEAVGRSITMLIPPELPHEESDILSRIRRGERLEHFETVRVRKDGQRIAISVTISPIFGVEGRIIGASKIARDITEAKRIREEREQLMARAEAARAEAEAANRAKDEFLATLSHELRSPLNAILGWAHVLQVQRSEDAAVERAVTTIIRNAEQQKQLINDLLDLSSIVAGKLRLNRRPIDLVTAVDAAAEAIRPTAEVKEIAVERRGPNAGALLVEGDPDRLQQVFWNLLTNAVKFTPAGGRIDVGVERRDSSALVSIRDSGVGIRPDVLPYIFDRFSQADSSMTRRYGGLGLGLALVRQLVQLHDGSVEAASAGEGQGARFTVQLPLTAPPAAPVGARAGNAVACRLHVLVVDDEPDARALFGTLLEATGATVAAAATTAEALRLFEARRPDVIVSDIAMPDEDGYTLIRAIRALPAGRCVPAIAVTAHARVTSREQAVHAGFDGYITKPVDAREFVDTVMRLAASNPRTAAIKR